MVADRRADGVRSSLYITRRDTRGAVRCVGALSVTGKRALTALGGARLRLPLRADPRSWSSSPSTASRDVSLWDGFTTSWFGEALHDHALTIPAIETSFKIALVNSVIATSSGRWLALALARMWRAFRVPFDAIVYLTLVVPEIVFAIASLIFFSQAREHVSRSPPRLETILIAHVVFNASLVMLVVRARFVGMGSDARGGELRPRRRAAVDLPAGDAAAALPGDPRRRAARRSRSRSTTT